MSYIHFDKSSLVNLSYGLKRELLRTNRNGAYGSTTLIGCNTSRYHGLLVAPQPYVDGDLHVLLSSLDESIIQHEEEFHLAVHRYQNGYYYPKGHKYIRELTFDPMPALFYRVGGVLLKKERINTYNGVRFMVRYTLLEAHSDTTLKICPLLAYRNRHQLSKANNDVDKHYDVIHDGIKCRMYNGYSYLHFQLNKPFEYVHAPDWYYNFEYEKDIERGYYGLEDLYTPGFFEIKLAPGESVILSVGIEESNPNCLTRLFNNELARRMPRDSFRSCLLNAAQQFLINENGKYKVIAGYQWLGVIPRDTFISLPGLTLTQNKPDIFRSVINAMVEDMSGAFFKFSYNIHSSVTPSADASLWFIWALQQYAFYCSGGNKDVYKRWWKYIKIILYSYKNGTDYGIYADENCLLHHGREGLALTWMNSVVLGKPVTPRTGYAVEINALWYNAICFAMEIAASANDNEFVEEWKPFAEKLAASFLEAFWSQEHGYLCDFFNDKEKNYLIRPNQLIAIAMRYTPLSMPQSMSILKVVHEELMTPRGIRSLSPRHEQYLAKCEGDHNERGLSQHSGSAYPWLLIFYAISIFKLEGGNYAGQYLKKIVADFEPEMSEGGIGLISQLYNGNPPYEGSGTISQATNVSALLWVTELIKISENSKVVK
ncbi:MAG: amylo-alpha-1,6-glucosidase [Bacteroidales bacterium]|jgi:predicted glycogen debranching enzyme|nr:glycogen debranching enzyme N-terminal domain-containing protein [Bacteroidales bacterium]MDD2204902.1 amylo-alpha-1,6-glucosidase [Bacteroidales bacterium]MDD3914525.1 amylo-alpha-1,6-glucosidase [Bacteroidales bacterium]MDD4634419.1 amylo-alpha-1,6-glucosidase [Bacteroidales bacterium]